MEDDYVLIVEDSPTQALQLKILLTQNSYSVSVARNGVEALACIREVRPTLVISDIVTPEMDGYELCRAIRADDDLRELPVILLTVLADPKDVLRALVCGADGFFTEPYDEKQLLTHVKYITENRRPRRDVVASTGSKIHFEGEEYSFASEPQRVLDLLLSTYEAAVLKNLELTKARDELIQVRDELRAEVAERKAAEEALRQSEERYRSVVETSPDAIVIADLNARIMAANQRSAELHGYTNEEMRGMSAFDLVPPEGLERGAALLRAVMESGIIRNGELTMLRKNGARFPAEFSASLIRDAQGNPSAVMGMMRDITERKHAEEAQRNALEESRQRAAEAAALLDGARAVLEHQEFDDAVGPIFDSCAGLIGAAAGSVFLRSGDGIRDKVAFLELGGLRRRVDVELATPINALGEDILLAGRALYHNDFPNSQWARHLSEGHPALENVLCAPLAIKGKVEGVLVLANKSGGFAENDARIAKAFGELAAIALHDSRMLESLEKSEERLRSIVDTASDPIISVDSEGMIVFCNNAAEAIYGYSSDEMCGKPLTSLAPERHRESGLQKLRALVSLGQQGVPSSTIEVTGLRKDGSEFPAELSYACWKTREGIFFTGIVRDITERKRAEEGVEKHLQQLNALRSVDAAITASLDLRVSTSVILDQVTAQLGVDAADLLLLNKHAQTLEYAAGRGFRTGAIARSRPRLGEGHAGHAALERRIVSIPNLSRTGAAFTRAALLEGEQFHAYCAVPLIARGHLNGVLEIFHRAPLNADPEWLDLLSTFAAQTAIAVDNAALFQDLQRANTEMALAYDTTIEVWSRALDLGDKESEGHARRGADLALGLARQMGMSGDELVHIRRGALLHDIGKVAIPESILLKPGPLTDEEWAIVRNYPTYAYELLSSVAYLRPALDIPYCHHEKWDGTGYPRGLKSEAIPIAARIFAVANVWNALTSNRSYRSAWSPGEAREHIISLSGTEFDPKAVEAFLRLEP